MRTRILLVDDHSLVRQGLRSILEDCGWFEIIAEAADGQEGVELALQLRPDVVVMDFSMPRLNGAQAARILADRAPQIRVIGISMYDDGIIAQQMLGAGAVAYLTKSASPPRLISLIQQVAGNAHAESPSAQS